MNRPLLVVGVVSSLAFVCLQARAKEIPNPAELSTNLQQLQTRISQGDAVASRLQPKLLRDMAIAFSEADASVWDKKVNTDAAIVYLMSGGNPGALANLRPSGEAAAEKWPLLRGVLAYVLGRKDEAIALLSGLDPVRLDPSIAGQIAFAQSVLASESEPKKAIKALDYARLLAPGGLVEDASLRREALLLAELPDTRRFLQLTEQYLIRFPRSPFAPKFISSFLEASVIKKTVANPEDLKTFDVVAGMLPKSDHLRALLAISRQSLLGARLGVARQAADFALRLAPLSGGEKEQARLYRAGADLTTDRYDAAVAQLQSVNVTELPRDDRELARALRQLSTSLREPSGVHGSVEDLAKAGSSDHAPRSRDDDAAIQLAEGALREAKAALREDQE